MLKLSDLLKLNCGPIRNSNLFVQNIYFIFSELEATLGYKLPSSGNENRKVKKENAYPKIKFVRRPVGTVVRNGTAHPPSAPDAGQNTRPIVVGAAATGPIGFRVHGYLEYTDGSSKGATRLVGLQTNFEQFEGPFVNAGTAASAATFQVPPESTPQVSLFAPI